MLGIDMIDTSRPPRLLWAPVQVETLSWRIISQVRAALFAGQLKPGDFLGSEASLAEHFRVSRMASRDALRSLEAVGIVQIRQGTKGGAWIAEGNPDRFADALSIQLQLIGVTVDEIFEGQLAIESIAAELAASRASASDVEQLKLALVACEAARGDKQAFTAASMRFHEVLVEISQNRVLLAQFRALRLVLQPLLEPNSTEEVARKVIRSHSVLVRAITEGDAGTAGTVMRQRIADVRLQVFGKATAPSAAHEVHAAADVIQVRRKRNARTAPSKR